MGRLILKKDAVFASCMGSLVHPLPTLPAPPIIISNTGSLSNENKNTGFVTGEIVSTIQIIGNSTSNLFTLDQIENNQTVEPHLNSLTPQYSVKFQKYNVGIDGANFVKSYSRR